MGDEGEYFGVTIEHTAWEVENKAEVIEDKGRRRGKGERSTARWREVRGRGRSARAGAGIREKRRNPSGFEVADFQLPSSATL